MSTPPSDASSREQRLNAVLHDYLQAVDAGKAPAKEEVLRGHPDLADELAAFFADQERMDRLAGDMRTTEPAESPDAAPLIRYVGDYELLEEIARGGMGVVFKARQVSLNRLVAVKMILSGRLAEPAEVERFRREAGAAAQLDHPNIVPIYEVGEHQGHHYYSMKLIEGDNLGVEMPHFTADHNAAALLLAKVARAVQHAHEHGILHRDIKPGNILLDSAKQPHVTDFGLARRLDESSSLSASGAVIGTVSYMAPEQAAAQCRQLTAAADVYALGAVLYEMLTGRPPFKNPNVVQTLRDVVEREPERPRKLNRRVSRDLEVICLKCLDKRPHRRYATAAALADDLERCVQGRPIQGRTVGRPERLWLLCRRRPVAVGLVATVFLLVVLSVRAAGLWLQANAVQQRTEEWDHLRYLNLISEACAFLRDDNVTEAKGKLEECPPANRSIEWRYAYARATEPSLAFQDDASWQALFGGNIPPNPNLGLRSVLKVGYAADSSRVVTLDSVNYEWKVERASDGLVLKSWRWGGGIPVNSISAMSIDGDGSHIGLVNGWTVAVWSLDTGTRGFYHDFSQDIRYKDMKDSNFFIGHGLPCQVALSPDSRRFAITTQKEMTVWNTSDGTILFSYPHIFGSILDGSMAFSPDSSRLAAGRVVFDANTGKELLKLPECGAIHYSADGRRILSSNYAGDTILIDALTGEVQLKIQKSSMAAAITPDGKRLLLAGGRNRLATHQPQSSDTDLFRGGNFNVWVGDALTGQEIANIPFPLNDHATKGGCLATISPDGERIGVFFADRTPWWIQPSQPR